jgi:hypothetical protein
MSGAVAITLREKNGRETRMCRWTNLMPYYLVNEKMYQQDQCFIDELRNSWLEMEDDYKKNEKTGDFQFEMSDFYGSHGKLAPIDYGISVVDLKNNIILNDILERSLPNQKQKY